jgi:ubiquinone/menaquinone biosynthesis C-methylase UbiE
MRDSKDLKKIVRNKYAEIALANSCCCGKRENPKEYSVFNDSYANKSGYVKDADMGLGCGLPTEYAGISTGDSVLDLGSGAGNDCFVARAIVGETGKITGLDFTEEMLSKARLNNKKMGFSNVEFVKGDIENMPLPDSNYDVVISNCVLNLVPDKKKAFSEIKRVLKPDGHFCVSDIVLKGELPENLREAAAMYAGCVSGALQEQEYINIIKNTGFSNIEVKKLRKIEVPDSLLLKYVSQENLNLYKETGGGIYSITVTANK